MSTTTKQYVTIVAIAVLLLSVVAVWQVADVRAAQATESKKSALADKQVSSRQAPADYDGDGVTDSTDRCPTRPETSNGFQDGDGCPDVVATTGAS